ncbi:DUF1127 domain-containing protein [Labrys wisconsinensis]|uniref:Uncharacterized protein YjiS (DUF1127 family) n=1 Tax=Labrys wisconsinensis TaxID=425677 RepID=A0ABU0JMH0_9HYPH|nr:DUF1127 domain-containing protein [Labrys wisconsinensis]MDQ0475476.1 uncharacterized protein YjiS (DUF1127 family) [Labrys wisconsinensis]
MAAIPDYCAMQHRNDIYCAAYNPAKPDQVRGTTIMIFSSFVASVIARYRAYKAYRQRLRELDSLDDREMSDLGISRADIHWLARQG